MITDKLLKSLMAGAAIMLLPACNGIFGDIYDEAQPDTPDDYGFNESGNTTGSIYVDATSYTDWVYIDFHTRRVTTLGVDDPAPESWDVAVHRYDAKTNGATVAETGATSFNSLGELTSVADGAFVADVWTTSTIVTDMSTMMDGYLGYADSYYNAELSKWLNVDTSTMPPIYTPSNKVYVVRLTDGTTLGLRLADFMDASGIKGFLTIEYAYPL